MIEYEEVVASYLRTWNERDPVARRSLLEAGWEPDATYVDPLAEVCGHDGIDAAVTGAQEAFDEYSFRLIGAVDGHHTQCRFSWELGPEGQDAPVAGFDVLHLGPDGRIRAVLGFLDRLPAGTAA